MTITEAEELVLDHRHKMSEESSLGLVFIAELTKEKIWYHLLKCLISSALCH